MLGWMIMPLKRYAEFSGRSRRKEYWAFLLLNVIVIAFLLGFRFGTGGGVSLMEAAQTGGPLAVYGALFSGVGMLLALWWLGTLIPNIAVNVRRLHDRDMSGWWYLGVFVAAFIPLVGTLVSLGYLVLMCLAGTAGSNRFGDDPKNPSAGAEVFA